MELDDYEKEPKEFAQLEIHIANQNKSQEFRNGT